MLRDEVYELVVGAQQEKKIIKFKIKTNINQFGNVHVEINEIEKLMQSY